MTMKQVGEFCEQPDFERAYAIHGKHYDGNGGEVSQEDQEFYDAYINKLVFWEDDAKNEYSLPLSISLWLIYAVKYVSVRLSEVG